MIVPELPTKTDQGAPITYTWEEVVPVQVAQDYPEADRTIVTEGTVTTITHKHTPEKTSASIEVIWVDENNASGKRPDSLSVTLSDSQEVSLSTNTDPEKDWRATKTDLPKYLRGNEIQYSWNVPDVDGYTKEVTPGNASNGNVTTVTYTLKPVKDTVTVTINAELFKQSENDNFWDGAQDWFLTLQQIFVNGNGYNGSVSNQGRLDKNAETISFEVPKNSTVRFFMQAGGNNVMLNSFLGSVPIKVLRKEESGDRTVLFKVGEDNIDLFAIMSQKGLDEVEQGNEPVENDKSTVYVGINNSPNQFTLNSGLFSQVLENVPINSELSLTYSWSGLSQTDIGWELYYLDKETNQTYEWKNVSNSGYHNHTSGATDNVQIGNHEEYLILIRFDINDKDKFTVNLSPKDNLNGLNSNSEKSELYVLSKSSPIMAAATLSPMLPSEPMMAGGPKRVVTNNGHFVQDDIDFDQLANDGYVEDTAFNNGTDPYTETVTLTLKEGQGFGWEQSFPAQDKYDSEGNAYIYYVEEIAFSGDDYHTASITGDPNEGETVVVTNVKDTPETGSLSLTKKVSGDGADATKTFAFTISLTASAGVELENSYPATHSGDNTISTAVINDGIVSNIQLKGGETYTINNLPVGTSYTISETDYSTEGYTPTVTAGGGLTGTIAAGEAANAIEVTNIYSAVDITVVKIDETTRNKENPSAQKTLPGAKFKLYKLTTPPGGGTASYTVYPDASRCEKTIESNGQLSYQKLPNGRYKIEESKVPDGYITQQDVEFYFTVSEGSTLTWSDSDGTELQNQDQVHNMVGYTPTNKTFTVGNEPGPSLPSTGGSGTYLFYLLGSALAIFAAALLGMRRKRH